MAIRRGILTNLSCNAAMILARRSCADRFPRLRVIDACGAGYDRELTTMLPDRIGFALPFAASFVGLSLIAGCIGASAQQPRRGAAPAAVARPAAPAIARPAAPAFHPAPAPQRPAMAPRQMPQPHFAAPSRPAAPRFAAPRPSFQRPTTVSRPPAVASRPVPRIAESRRPSAPAAAQRTAVAAAVQAAARGRFAARFRNNADPRAQVALAARLNGWAPRNAWRHHVHAAFVPWLGPVFWPYVYSDIFDYTFWPEAYDDAYWAYAYDDLIDTVFWDNGSPYSAYASIAPNGSVAPDGYIEPGGAIVGSSRLRERSGLSPQALRQLCRNPDRGITAWPFAEITRALRPTSEQRTLLDQVKSVAGQAADALKNSCSDTYALTPPGRLRAMINRISATLEAVRMVRPALEAFYNALSDEQRARFNTLSPRLPAASEDQPQQEAKAESCGASKSSLTGLPIERIDAVLRPTGAQKGALDRLSAATKKAVHGLQAACPDEVPVTPVGRLQAMEKRLSAMLQAANQMQPALDDFYASLTTEQKARFNTLQQVAGQ